MAFKRPREFAPGAEYEYCNTNYYLLGLVAEKIDGKSLAAIFQDRLFGPLGMKDTILPPAASNTHSRALFAWLPLRQYVIRAGRCALSRGPRGRGESGNARAER